MHTYLPKLPCIGFISLNDAGVEVCANRLSYLVAKGGESTYFLPANLEAFGDPYVEIFGLLS